MASRPAPPAKRQRRENRGPTDWREFYKNGVPEEIIVIDSSESPEPASVANPHGEKRLKAATGSGYAANGSTYTNSVSVPTHSHSPAHPQLQYQTRQPAPPSVARQNGVYAKPRLTNGAALTSASTAAVAGTKRKRITRAATAANVANVQGGHFHHYFPPEGPIRKSKEVHVEPINEPRSSNQGPIDDEDGHFIVTPGTPLTKKYEIVRLLGQGTFGKVVEAVDVRSRKRYAIKVIRSVQKYRDASRIELRVLQTLQIHDRDNRNKCIHLRECFDYRNHICIVTDLYGMSVFDFLKSNNFAPFPNSHIQSFARQLLISVTYLHDLNLIHTDLKPENILLVKSDNHEFSYNMRVPSSSHTTSRSITKRKVLLDTEIRLIDFGSATFNDEYHSSVVSTRHYRAPEIIMGLGWSFPCDIWSIGCILVEFFTGDALFQTHDNLEHLAMMQEVVGTRIDAKLVRALNSKTGSVAQAAQKMFKGLRLEYPNNETSRSSKRYVEGMKRLDEIIPPHTSHFNRLFNDLLKKIFVYDPSKRITAKEALDHPWFRESVGDEGVDAAQMRVEKEMRTGRPPY
ncbi:kinase-like protein [Ascobolus immersus RN42]|uniref:dual-specificity kinase n=1 Tax=Ascobolus immersus RN42 TaxID=1160509 RepID=A0A3N4HZ39_ASCIM|nr:kinase-like protein [Ascobolus immersus RN42]